MPGRIQTNVSSSSTVTLAQKKWRRLASCKIFHTGITRGDTGAPFSNVLLEFIRVFLRALALAHVVSTATVELSLDASTK